MHKSLAKDVSYTLKFSITGDSPHRSVLQYCSVFILRPIRRANNDVTVERAHMHRRQLVFFVVDSNIWNSLLQSPKLTSSKSVYTMIM